MPDQEFLIKRILFSRLFTVAGILILFLFLSALGKEVINHHQLDEEIAKLESDVKAMENRHSKLVSLISYYESSDFWEKEARSKLGLVKKGENVLVLSGFAEKSVAEEKVEEEKRKVEEKEKSNINKWKEFFIYGRK